MFKNSYYWKLQLSFLVLILLPIVALSFLSYSNTRDSVMHEIRLTNQSVLNIMEKDISKNLDDIAYASHLFSNNSRINDNLRDFSTMNDIKSYEDYKTYLSVRESFELVSIKILSTDITMFVVNKNNFIIPYMDIVNGKTGAFQELNGHWEMVNSRVNFSIPNKLQWLGVINPENENDSFYYFARVIRDKNDGDLLSTLYIGISSKYYDKIFSNSKTGSFALFDKSGNRIAGNTSLKMNLPASNNNIRNEIMIPKTEWKLIHETKNEAITGQLSKTFNISILIFTIFFLIFLFISFIIAIRLHKPIRNLTNVAKKYGKGNREVRYHVEGKDEINQLGQTLNIMLDQINDLINDIKLKQEEKRVLELQALFAQIRPHFLLNTLNSIKISLILSNDNFHSQKIDSLMGLLRAYMKINDPWTIQDECHMLHHYIEIMKMRTDLQLDLYVSIDHEIRDFELPRLMLQPIVENAIIHGFIEVEESNGEIRIDAKLVEGFIVISIQDNGIGLEEYEMKKLRSLLQNENQDTYKRIGIVNVLNRLQLTFGEDAFIHIKSNKLGGLAVDLHIPKRNNFS
ncbi:hypothetical protein WQ54_07660 [Bacillus sp. SA1-12]|nr:hypothetical protein WQ54_07660 [Bacillus sp. SA1-12]